MFSQENIRKALKYLAPFAIVGIIAVFIYNMLHNGQVDNPGKGTYTAQCAQCHGENGEGIKTLVPPFSNNSFAANNFDSIPCWLRDGMNHPILVGDKTYDQPMYPSKLDEIQTANVINYLDREYLHLDKEVSSAWVKKQWEQCK